MENIKITADSICDLPQEILTEHNISIIPLCIYLDDKEERDYPGIDKKIYDFYHQTKKTPKTSAINASEYEDFFRANLPENGSLIHFNISGGVSSTYNNAVQASKAFKNVFVIDSRSLTTGTAISMLRAIKYRDAGMSATEIVKRVNEETNKVQCSFILDDLTYLHRGGRCSGTAKIFATALHIKPQIVLKDGKMEAGKKFMGNFEMCVKKYIDYTFDTNPQPDLSILFITHTKMSNPQLVENVKKQILARYPFEKVVETIAGGTVTSHCGENTLGIIYGLK